MTKRLNNATQKLLPLPTKKLGPEDLLDNFPARDDGRTHTAEEAKAFILDWYGLTDVGSVRDHNEDTFSCVELERAVLFVVADGMGGHDAGEVASRIAVDTVAREVTEGMARHKEPLALVKRSVCEANREVLREAARQGSNMGTTLEVALISEGTAYVASVGDSRAYWIENGSISQITEDHSLVAKLVAAGKLTREEARNHPKSNLLYRTIGAEEDLKVDTFQVELNKKGCLLLCTDGLWGEVTDEEIHRACAEEKTVQAACQRLVRMANENGGKDNITAVMARVA